MDASHPVIIVIAMQSLIAKLSVLLLSFEMTPKTVIPIIATITDSQIFEEKKLYEKDEFGSRQYIILLNVGIVCAFSVSRQRKG